MLVPVNKYSKRNLEVIREEVQYWKVISYRLGMSKDV